MFQHNVLPWHLSFTDFISSDLLPCYGEFGKFQIWCTENYMCSLNVCIMLLAIDSITKHLLLLLGQLRDSSYLYQREDSNSSGNRRESRHSSLDSFVWDASSFAHIGTPFISNSDGRMGVKKKVPQKTESITNNPGGWQKILLRGLSIVTWSNPGIRAITNWYKQMTSIVTPH